MHNRAATGITLRNVLMFPVVLALSAIAREGQGADLDLNKLFHESIPDSPFIGVVYAYTDAMLEHGRDTYGSENTGMLLSALDRKTLCPLETRPPAPDGVSDGSRPGPALSSYPHFGPLPGRSTTREPFIWARSR